MPSIISTVLFWGIAFAGVNADWDINEKRCNDNDCAANLRPRIASGVWGDYEISKAYSQSAADASWAEHQASSAPAMPSYSLIIPSMSGGWDYPSVSAYPSASADPSASSYYYPSYQASSYYGATQSQAPGSPRPAGQHGRPNGGLRNGGQRASQSSSPPTPGPAGNSAPSISSLGGNLLLALGGVTGLVAFVL